MDGEVRSKENNPEIIVRPENWEEMVKKHEEREKEQLQKLMERRKVETEQELKDIAAKAIVKRATRGSSEYKPLKDRTIIKNPTSEQVLEFKKELVAEISAVGKRILVQPSSPKDAEEKG